MKTTVQVMYRSADSWNWKKELRTLSARPMQGDFIQFPGEMSWYKVETVVHVLGQSEFQLAVYCVDAETAMGYLGDYDRVAME